MKTKKLLKDILLRTMWNVSKNKLGYFMVHSSCTCLITSSPIGIAYIAVGVSVCICPLAYLKNIRPNFTNFFVHVTCGRGLVFL